MIRQGGIAFKFVRYEQHRAACSHNNVTRVKNGQGAENRGGSKEGRELGEYHDPNSGYTHPGLTFIGIGVE